MNRIGRAVCSLAVFLFLSTAIPAFSQVARGTIVGTVSDNTRAVIPGVEVTITNVGTNQTRHVTTNEQGNYEASLLPIGQYSVASELPGFKTEIRQGIALSVGDRLRVDFRLEIGEISERVEFTGDAPLVKTEDASMSAVMDQRKVVDLPSNGRDFTRFAYLIPSAFAPGKDRTWAFAVVSRSLDKRRVPTRSCWTV